MIWNNAFINETGNYGVSAEVAGKDGTGSVALVFYVRKNNTPDAWNVTFRLQRQHTQQIPGSTDPSAWIWQQGVEILDRSSRTNRLRNGEFVLNPVHLRTSPDATLDELTPAEPPDTGS